MVWVVASGFHSGVHCLAQSVSFGSRQLSQLLDDRPEMDRIFCEGSPVLTWVIDRFNRGDSGSRCYWDNSETKFDSTVEHQPRVGSRSVFLRVTGRNCASPVDKWVCLLFELCLVEYSQTYSQDMLDLQVGIIDEKSFVQKCVRREYSAICATKGILEGEKWNAKIAENPLTMALWKVPESYEEFVGTYSSNPLTNQPLTSRFQKLAKSLLAEPLVPSIPYP